MSRSARAGSASVVLLAAFFSAAPAARADEGVFSSATVRAVDAAIPELAELLARSQRGDGSWEGEAGTTALAVQALAAVEPSSGGAAAVENGIRFLLQPPAGPDPYALAYALAASHRRPGTDDLSGLLAHGPRLRPLLRGASGCTDFQAAVLSGALRVSGAPAAEGPSPGAAGCAGRAPDLRDPEARALTVALARFKRGGASPRPVQRAFNGLVRREEKRRDGRPDLEGLLWASVGLTEMRMDVVEPKRGCYFSADLLATRVLSLRGEGGARAAASALLALVHLRYVAAEAFPLRGAASQ